MEPQDARLGKLWGWHFDADRDLRELEEWKRVLTPFLEQLQADMIYRQRRHAETVGRWSTTAKVTAALVGIAVGVATIGGFVLSLYLAMHGVSVASR